MNRSISKALAVFSVAVALTVTGSGCGTTATDSQQVKDLRGTIAALTSPSASEINQSNVPPGTATSTDSQPGLPITETDRGIQITISSIKYDREGHVDIDLTLDVDPRGYTYELSGTTEYAARPLDSVGCCSKLMDTRSATYIGPGDGPEQVAAGGHGVYAFNFVDVPVDAVLKELAISIAPGDGDAAFSLPALQVGDLPRN